MSPIPIYEPLRNLVRLWTTPEVITVDPTSAIESDPSYRSALAAGKLFYWASVGKVEKRAKAGWKPFTKRTRLGRTCHFMDKSGEFILLMK